jgi:hypothetical protein
VNGFAERREQLVAELGAVPGGATLRLEKATSNLFRDREAEPRQRLDVRAFDHVLEVDPAGGWVDVERTCRRSPAATLARRDAVRRPAEVDHDRRRGAGIEDRGLVVRTALFTGRCSSWRCSPATARCWWPARQRAPRLFQVPQLLRHARLCAAREGEPSR